MGLFVCLAINTYQQIFYYKACIPSQTLQSFKGMHCNHSHTLALSFQGHQKHYLLIVYTIYHDTNLHIHVHNINHTGTNINQTSIYSKRL